MTAHAPPSRATGDDAAAACWACGGHEVVELTAYAPLPLRRCTGCGLAFQPAASAAETAALYDPGYFADYDLTSEDTAADRRFEADVRVRWLRTRLGAGRVLELGSAGGWFLDALRRHGLEARGVEVSPEIAEAARSRFGVDVLVGRVEDVALPEAAFDAACAWHVIEHIPDPLRSLQAVEAALRPGAPLFVEVPNFGGLRARREGLAWPSLQPRYHVAQYGPTSLGALLARAGFEVERIETVPYAVYRRPARALLSHAKHAVLARTWPFGAHPEKHELLRAVARRAA